MKLIPFLFALVLPFQTEGIEDLLKVDQALRGKAFEKAVKLADEAIAKSPKNERLYYLRGLANSGLRDYTSALKDFDNSLKANPPSITDCNNSLVTPWVANLEIKAAVRAA